MKTITVGELRQNPTRALDDVEGGETYVITRHRREIGRIVPPPSRARVNADDLVRVLGQTPVDDGWADELARTRADFDDDHGPWAA